MYKFLFGLLTAVCWAVIMPLCIQACEDVECYKHENSLQTVFVEVGDEFFTLDEFFEKLNAGYIYICHNGYAHKLDEVLRFECHYYICIDPFQVPQIPSWILRCPHWLGHSWESGRWSSDGIIQHCNTNCGASHVCAMPMVRTWSCTRAGCTQSFNEWDTVWIMCRAW